jgi:hypothetical protein
MGDFSIRPKPRASDQERDRSWWSKPLVLTLVGVASVVGVAAVALTGGRSNPPRPADKTVATTTPRTTTTALPQTTTTVALPTTTVALPTTTVVVTPPGFVQPEPALAGKLCQSVANSPGANPSGIVPTMNPWGVDVFVDPGAPASATQDLTAAQSMSNATHVIQAAWQANGYQYPGLSVPCLNNYDGAFHWVSDTTQSISPTTVSTTFSDLHSLVAVRSQSGTCWYELNVMTSGDPIIDADGLDSYGVYSSTSGGACSASAAPGYGLWQREGPIPAQLHASSE